MFRVFDYNGRCVATYDDVATALHFAEHQAKDTGFSVLTWQPPRFERRRAILIVLDPDDFTVEHHGCPADLRACGIGGTTVRNPPAFPYPLPRQGAKL